MSLTRTLAIALSLVCAVGLMAARPRVADRRTPSGYQPSGQVVSPLDAHNDTLACAWNWVEAPASGPWNPIVAAQGGSGCDIAEHASPNWSSGVSTSGLSPDGIGASRVDEFLDNNTSGGWGDSTWTGPGALTGNLLLRAVVQTPGAFATSYVVYTLGESNAAQFRIFIEAASTRFSCQYDDGPGSASTVVLNGAAVSTIYFVDCYVPTATNRVTLCVNGSCTTSGVSSGGSLFTPDVIGLGSSQTGSAVWGGYLLEVQLHRGVDWWSESVSAADCASVFGSACSFP